MRFNNAVAEHLQQFHRVLDVRLRLAFREAPPENADNAAAFQKRQVRRNRRNLTAGESNHENATIPGHGSKAIIEQGPANRIKYIAPADYREKAIRAQRVRRDDREERGIDSTRVAQDDPAHRAEMIAQFGELWHDEET